MKIILSNYRYFMSGGPEKYLFSVKEELGKAGHNVFPFSVNCPMNEATRWSEYFVSPISNGNSDYFADYKKDIKTAVRILERNIYSYEVYKKAKKYAAVTSAELAYSLHFMNKLSPALIDGFKAAGLPLVVRLSDFGLICPQQSLFCQGSICNDCLKYGLYSCVKKKCVHNSYMGSIIKALTLKIHYTKKTFDKIDAFICPSQFLKDKFIEAGFDGSKFFHVPSFIQSNELETGMQETQYEDYILYTGRVTREKGVEVLLKAWKRIKEKKVKLIVIGNTGESEYAQKIFHKYGDIAEFHDFMPFKQLKIIIQNALLIVVPSIWYENMPNTIIEAFFYQKPVIASNIGSIPEMIENDVNGRLFSPGDHEQLSEQIKEAIDNKKKYREMGKQAGIVCQNRYSSKIHIKNLFGIFNRLVHR